MTFEITIAIVTAGIALGAAAAGLIVALVVHRQSTRTAQQVEALRQQLTRPPAHAIADDPYLKQGILALDALIQAIQRVKDLVQLVLNAFDTSLDSKSALASMTEARQHLFECYETQLPNLQQGEARGAHRAKNTALTIEMTLRQNLTGHYYVSDLAEAQKQALQALRDDLTDAQNLLRDSRTAMLFGRSQSDA